MDTKVFDRIEKKYLITNAIKKNIVKSIKSNMKKDTYFHSKVYNIYFDNKNYDLITQSIDWENFKEKIRARSYGGYDRVFLEIKTKIRGKENNVGYKRRVMITHHDFENLIKKQANLETLASKSIEKNDDLQIAREIDYLIQSIDLTPKIPVVYDRESYSGDNNLRITFDENLKYRTENLSFNQGKGDKMYFKDDRNIIMEVKAHGVLPLWLVKLMSENKIYPERFSKIGNIYQKIRKEENV